MSESPTTLVPHPTRPAAVVLVALLLLVVFGALAGIRSRELTTTGTAARSAGPAAFAAPMPTGPGASDRSSHFRAAGGGQ